MSKCKHFKSFDGKTGLTVDVRGGNIDGAIRLLSRRVKQEGLLRELRARSFYEKPSTAKRRKRAEAISRARKLTQKEDK